MRASTSTSTSDPGLRGGVAAALLGASARIARDADAPLAWDAAALVFAPHPDDEVLGCGGTIALKALAGASLCVAIMTDGRTSHSRFVDAPTLVAMRRAEALDAAGHLGLDPAGHVFLDFEDGRLRDNAEAARRRVGDLLREHEPEQVFVPHRRDRLADHVATFEIVTAAVREFGRPVTLFEYPVWLWNGWPWTPAESSLRRRLTEMPRVVRDACALAFGCRTRVDIRSVLPRKTDALAQHRSQVERRNGDPRWPILSDVSEGAFVSRLLQPTEVFRKTEMNVK